MPDRLFDTVFFISEFKVCVVQVWFYTEVSIKF